MTIDYFDVERADALMAATGSRGCAQHNEPSCLCDVVIESPTQITDVPPMLWNYNDRKDFARLAELMLAKQEFVVSAVEQNADQHRAELFDEQLLADLWHSHWRCTVRQEDVAARHGVDRRLVARIAAVLGWDWIRTDNAAPTPHPARDRYLELRDDGFSRSDALHILRDEYPNHEITVKLVKNWWWRRNAGLQAVAS